MSSNFQRRGIARVGRTEEAAPPAHALLKQLRTGKLIFIKSCTPQRGLSLKAIEIVTQSKARTYSEELGTEDPVREEWSGDAHMARLRDKWPRAKRRNTRGATP